MQKLAKAIERPKIGGKARRETETGTRPAVNAEAKTKQGENTEASAETNAKKSGAHDSRVLCRQAEVDDPKQIPCRQAEADGLEQIPCRQKENKPKRDTSKITTRERRTARKTAAREAEHICHPLEPVFGDQSRVLILGTMPSPASRAARFYYGHPQNRFWRVLAALWDEPTPTSNDERTSFALRHHLALWDVLASCDIIGAADASIRNARANDLSRVIDHAPISAVFTTGSKAAELYKRHCAASFLQIKHVALPSTSAANARMSLADLTRAYASLRKAADAPSASRPQ